MTWKVDGKNMVWSGREDRIFWGNKVAASLRSIQLTLLFDTWPDLNYIKQAIGGKDLIMYLSVQRQRTNWWGGYHTAPILTHQQGVIILHQSSLTNSQHTKKRQCQSIWHEKMSTVITLHQPVNVVNSADQSTRCDVWWVEKVWKLWLPTVSDGDPAAKRQLPFGS